ncbi:hypothetical protein BC830DRAFT_27881 [Chytriomyces sp. MP71]|nr:hypothetical protein BC830DRAFT_27881 [Chytriomyces sp. MP71]
MKLTSLLPLCFFLPRPSQQRPLLSIPHRRQSIHPTENDPLKNNVFEDFGINPAEDTWTADKADIPTDSTPLRPITVPINRPAPASNIPAGLRGRNDARFTRRRLAARGHLLHTGDAHPTFAALYSGNLTNEANDLYVANVTLSNNQTFSMDLDTGSSDTWFRGFGCVTTVLAQDTSCDGRAVTSFAGMEHLKLSYVDL